MGCKQKSTIKADYGAVNKSVSEYWIESWERERDAAMPSLQRGTHLLDKRAGIWSAFFFLSFSLFHYSLKMMLHEVNQLSTKKCANLQCGSSSVPKCGSSSVPKSIFLNSTFLLFLASILSSLTTNLPILYEHFLRIPKIYLLFSIILPRYLFKSWFLYSLLINISFSFMSIFAITAIVFKGQKHRTEATKFRYLWYQKWSIILGSGVLVFGVFFHEYNDCTRHCLDLFQSFIFPLVFYTHHSAALAWLKPINLQ